MSQYVQEALTSVVPGIQYRTDRVSNFLWYPNGEHCILEAATGGLDAVTVRHNKMWLKYQTAYAGCRVPWDYTSYLRWLRRMPTRDCHLGSLSDGVPRPTHFISLTLR